MISTRSLVKAAISVIGVIPFAAYVTAAHAALVIGPGPTTNVTCASNVCTATASAAVLNVTDLQTMLASSDVKVATDAITNSIYIDSALTWVNSTILTLDAHTSITIHGSVSVTGSGGLVLTTNDGGTGGELSFGPRGSITFWNVSDSLTINGAAYTLVNNLAALASAIMAKANGDYALANDYDARLDGIYKSSPISTPFDGAFDGLGHSIFHLVIKDHKHANVGLFAEVNPSGVVGNIGLKAIKVIGNSVVHYESVGALVGKNLGKITGCFAKGDVSAPGATSYDMGIGGLIGLNSGTIMNSYIDGNVTGAGGAGVGGLVGWQQNGSITGSHSTGTVTVGPSGGAIGGLVGDEIGIISNSYSASSVVAGLHAGVGGLVGFDGWIDEPATISRSYATGNVSAGDYSSVGGLVGISTSDVISATYATGSVTGGNIPVKAISGVGGLIGETGYNSKIRQSYSIGTVVAGSDTSIGGIVGYKEKPAILVDLYWNTITSGITALSGGCGNINNCLGITGLTTIQLQSALPTGFNPAIWAENPSINGGLPYLLDNPPPG